MKRSLLLMTLLIGTIVFFSSCNDDLNNLEEGTRTNEIYEVELHDIAQRNCAMDAYQENLQDNPELLEEYIERQETFAELMEEGLTTRALCSNPVKIPVAVHFQNINNPNESCLETLAQSQIDVLNADYQGNNSDISTWNNTASSQFPGVSNGETCVEFVLATQNHPNGFGLSNGDKAVTYNQFTNDFDADWSGYINIIVRPNLGYLGYSPLGGGGNGDGVVIDANAFGVGAGCGSISPSAPYNLGRTLTHELGHYMNLDHIWGNGCNSDDAVSDTPNASDSNYGCPNIGISSCSSKDLHMNYMDYTDDACMYMFSAGQSTRMENWVSANLQNVVNNASSVLGSGGNPPSACTSPTDANSSSISNTAATITWSAVSGATKYKLRWREVGTTTWTRKNRTATSLSITGLTAGTQYEWQIRSYCSGTWQPYTSKKNFTTSGGGASGATTYVFFRVKLDYYGSETTWELQNSNGNVIDSGGPYTDSETKRWKKAEWDLADGCYTIRVEDSYGDGICCDYGDGFLLVKDENNQEIVESDGIFGNFTTLNICANNGNLSFTGGDEDAKLTSIAPKAPATTLE